MIAVSLKATPVSNSSLRMKSSICARTGSSASLYAGSSAVSLIELKNVIAFFVFAAVNARGSRIENFDI